MKGHGVRDPESNATTDARRQLLDMLDRIKAQNPELMATLEQLSLDQSEYDRAMLTILASEIGPYNTYTTANGPYYA